MVSPSGFAPVLHECAVLRPDVQSIGAEPCGPDGVVPTAEVLQYIIGGDTGERNKFGLRWSTAKPLSSRSDRIYDFLFAWHGLSFR